MQRKKILYCVLNWGLGHATRSLPLIREIIKEHELIIISTGRSLHLLRSEFPDLRTVDLPDYSVKYSNNKKLMMPALAIQLPKIFFALLRERIFIEHFVERENIDLIISDNRYGLYSRNIPSYFITHQLRFNMPVSLKFLEPVSKAFNSYYFKKFTKILIPDIQGEKNLSGNLSNSKGYKCKSKMRFVGPLSDTETEGDMIRSDQLFIISGPEPQRTRFENLIREQINELKGKKIIILGKPEEEIHEKYENVEIFSNVSRKDVTAMIKGAKIVISRPGYSTVMEIAALSKKALFIPTPGQTEQEYLAEYYKENQLFYSVQQKDLDLKNDVIKAKDYKGFQSYKVNNMKIILNEIGL